MDKDRNVAGGLVPGQEGRPQPGKILVIEDHLDLLQTLKLFFEVKNYEVFTEINCLEIIQVCLDERPDVIVLDTVLPYREAKDVFIELRRDPRTAQIPVVFF